MGFLVDSVVKNPPANAGDAEEENGNPLPCSCLGNPMDRGAWQATVHGVTKSRIQLSTHAHKICVNSFFEFGCSVIPAPFIKDYFFFIVLSLFLCQRSADHVYVDVFLTPLFYSIDPFIFYFTSSGLLSPERSPEGSLIHNWAKGWMFWWHRLLSIVHKSVNHEWKPVDYQAIIL